MSKDLYPNLTQKETMWLKRCRAARASGNVTKWCEENDVSRRVLYNWEKKIVAKGVPVHPLVEDEEVTTGPAILEDGGLGYLKDLSEHERFFATERKKQYMNDYPDLNDSVDMMSLHILIMQEVHIARLLQHQAQGKDVGERLEQAQKIFQNTAQKLGIDRGDRLKRGDTGNEGDIASFALSMQSQMPDIMRRIEQDTTEEEELKKKRRESGRDAIAIREEAPEEEDLIIDGTAG
jgi:hypothetical protein